MIRKRFEELQFFRPFFLNRDMERGGAQGLLFRAQESSPRAQETPFRAQGSDSRAQETPFRAQELLIRFQSRLPILTRLSKPSIKKMLNFDKLL